MGTCSSGRCRLGFFHHTVELLMSPGPEDETEEHVGGTVQFS